MTTPFQTLLSQLYQRRFHTDFTLTQRCAKELGLTQLPADKVITVTGTNGKGSTVMLLDHLLRAHGYRTARLTSPHILRFQERIVLNGVEVSEQAIQQAYTAISAHPEAHQLNFFAMVTLMALWLFQRESLDYCLLEVGVGGRLDPVNVVDADIAVVTNIALDHQTLLGNTREAIAEEKAGIFRPQQTIVCGDPNPPAVLFERAQQLRASWYQQGGTFGYRIAWDQLHWWHQQGLQLCLPRLSIHPDNLSVVCAVLAVIVPSCFERTTLPAAIRIGQAKGRLQSVPGEVEHIYDVAHNPAAFAYLQQWLMAKPCAGRTFIVCAMQASKQPVSCLQACQAAADVILTGEFPEAVAATAADYAPARLVNCQWQHQPSIELAYKLAVEQAKPGDRIVVCGSFYAVGRIMRYNSQVVEEENLGC